MLHKTFLILLLSAGAFALSGCVDQATADAKMARGCEAAVQALVPGSREIVQVKNTSFENKPLEDEGIHRHVTLSVLEKDGWAELDKSYNCVFLEQWGFLRTTHGALIMQVNIDDKKYGRAGSGLSGSIKEFIRLTESVDKAMGQ